MGFCGWLNYTLTLSMGITLFCSLVALVTGLVLRFSLNSLVESYFEPEQKNIHIKLLKNSHGEYIIPLAEELADDVYLGSWTNYLANMIIVMAFCLCSISLFGIVASKYRRLAILLSFSALTSIMVILEMIFVLHMVDLESGLHRSAQGQIYNLLRERFDTNPKTTDPTTVAFNIFMLMGGCCGVYGPADFFGVTMTYEFTDVEKFNATYAPACCKNRYVKKGFDAVVHCAKDSDSTNINNEGCYLTLYQYISTQYGGAIGGVIVFLLMWEVLQVMMSLSLIFRPKKSQKEAIKAAMIATGMSKRELIKLLKQKASEDMLDDSEPSVETDKSKEESVKNIFRPYAKRSSYPSLDMQRIKSTEIW